MRTRLSLRLIKAFHESIFKVFCPPQLATYYTPRLVNINLYYFMTIIYGLAFFINILAAIWYLVGILQPYSWITFSEGVKPNYSVTDGSMYVMSVYYVVTTVRDILHVPLQYLYTCLFTIHVFYYKSMLFSNHCRQSCTTDVIKSIVKLPRQSMMTYLDVSVYYLINLFYGGSKK